MSDNLVAFLPGWSGLPKASYNPLLMKMADWGFDTLSLEYDLGGTGSIGRTAHISERELDERREDYDYVILVGHSMGGIVGRLIDNSLYDAYVSVASPHTGTWKALAGSFFSKSAREMLPCSDLIATCPLPSVPALAISASHDFTVRNAHLWGAKNVTIPWTNHITVLWNPLTAETIRDWLPIRQHDRGSQSRVSVEEN